MKQRIGFKYLIATSILAMVAWTALTIYVELPGPSKKWTFKNENGVKTALVVFDPDPFYDLDEQICISFGKALVEHGISVSVVTVAAAKDQTKSDYDVIIYCANTYNWRPDWAITNYVADHRESFQNINTVAITLGAGSTEASQKHP